MNFSLPSGRVLQTRERAPAAIVRWDLMRPVAALPKPVGQAKRTKAAGVVDKIVLRREPSMPNPIPVGIRKAVPEVVRMVAAITGETASAIRGPLRHAEIVRARQIACYVARGTGASFPSIGRDLGGKDHTSILHGFRRAEAAIDALGIDATAPVPLVVAELWRRRHEWPKAAA